jgi:hypothetical protein
MTIVNAPYMQVAAALVLQQLFHLDPGMRGDMRYVII